MKDKLINKWIKMMEYEANDGKTIPIESYQEAAEWFETAEMDGDSDGITLYEKFGVIHQAYRTGAKCGGWSKEHIASMFKENGIKIP